MKKKDYRTLLSIVVSLFFFTLLFLVNLKQNPLLIPDETRYGEIPREMMASGDWVVPKLNGLDYFEKPVMGYWLHALSLKLFGDNPFGVRFPSAISVGITAMLLFFFLRGLAGTARAASASFIYISFLLVVIVGKISVLDGLLNVFLTAALGTFYQAVTVEQPGRARVFLLVSGLAAGLAFLTKGFVALAVIGLVAGLFLLWERRWFDLFRKAWPPALVALIVVLPWSILVHVRAPEFWHHFFWVEHVKRFTQAGGAQHPEPAWFFLPVLLVGAMPWTTLAPAVLAYFKNAEMDGSLRRFLICWFLAPLLLFSASSGKLATYILPIFPPLAAMMAFGFHASLRKNKHLQVSTLLTAFFILGLCVFLWQTQWLYLSLTQSRANLLLAGLFVWVLLLMISLFWHNHIRLVLVGLSPLLFFISLPYLLPTDFLAKKAPAGVLLSNKTHVNSSTLLVSNGSVFRAVCWYYQRNDVFLYGNPGELAYGLATKSGEQRLIKVGNLSEFIEEWRVDRDVVVFLPLKAWQELEHLPPPTYSDQTSAYAFAYFSRAAAGALVTKVGEKPKGYRHEKVSAR